MSLGPKSYAYRTNDGKTVTKLKGFTLNGATEDVVNFDGMLELLDNPLTSAAVPQDTLKRNLSKLDISEVPVVKRYKFTYDKRVVIPGPEYNTIPYGY